MGRPLTPLALVMLFGGALACPFCAPMPGVMTAQRLLAGSPYVALAVALAPSDELGAAGVRFRITRPIAGEGVEAGQVVRHVRNLVLSPGRAYLLQGKRADLSRCRVRAVPESFSSFLVAVAALPTGEGEGVQRRRLEFFARYLGAKHRVIAASVTEAFAKTPYDVVRGARRPALGVLVALIDGEPGSRVHQGLVYLLVGLDGSPASKGHLARWLASRTRREQVGFDGLLGAFLLTHGEAGLPAVAAVLPGEDAKVTARRWFAANLANALDFHGRQEDVLARGTVLRWLRRMMEDPHMAAPAVETLLAMEAWDSWEEVAALRRRHPDLASVRRATAAYLKACPDPRARAALAGKTR